ncbi:MAG: DUF6607 family protein [Gammaproteobacteria bacterium]
MTPNASSPWLHRAARVLVRVAFATVAVVAVLLAVVARAEDSAAPAKPAPEENTKRYIFSWPITSDPTLAPRGGTTRGPELTLDKAPSEAWKSLQTPGLSPFERDRRAILAMAGSYRVTFDFLEVTPFTADSKRERPYQSWGTERVFLDRDDGKFISLSHILVMRIVQKDGTLSEPLVTKHWRQDWRYEPAEVVEYRGREQWARRVLKQRDVAGQWSQTVFQVDESPRYASLGTWQHTSSFSSWISGDTWRPLPRREWSVRKDYQVLIGTNRHTIIPTGWIQEENNLKGALDDKRTLAADKPYIAREYGVARYERLQAPDFGAADQYYESTKKFWDDVRDAWTSDFHKQPIITLRAPVDQSGLFVPLFEQAEKIAAGEKVETDNAQVIMKSLQDMRAKPQ